MARKQHHEDHVNHEAWAIPYGDLITLLLAFFVVMYAVSTVNEGKYRVLAESMQSAFQGPTRTMQPIQIGNQIMRAPRDGTLAGMDPTQAAALPRDAIEPNPPKPSRSQQKLAGELEQAMGSLIDADLVAVTNDAVDIEVQIKTDILFASASADIGDDADEIVDKLAKVLAPLNNRIRIEGHTDNRPIATAVFPSNWELSAARAARMVRAFESAGIGPERMIVAGMGEHHPVGDNDTADGRRSNRRVILIIAQSAEAEPLPAEQTAEAIGDPDPTTPAPEGEGV
jgi:chemotaxis protein MotB